MNLSAMPPHHQHFVLQSLAAAPVSRTHQYRKVMKPLLERKRRARINRCLDELKDLLTGSLQASGENASKLEKADILELTVRHLRRLRERNALFLARSACSGSGGGSGGGGGSGTLSIEKFWAGFQHCVAEVSQFLGRYDRSVGDALAEHIASFLPNFMAAAAAAAAAANHVAAGVGSSALAAATNYRGGSAVRGGGQRGTRVHLGHRREAASEVELEAPPELDGVWRPW